MMVHIIIKKLLLINFPTIYKLCSKLKKYLFGTEKFTMLNVLYYGTMH